MYDLCGIGNAIVDMLVHMSEEEFQTLGLEKGSMTLVDLGKQSEFLEKITDRERTLKSGGSVANSLIAFSELGGKSAFLSSIGNDAFGDHYKEEFGSLGIDISDQTIGEGRTGTCMVAITPDGERTMQTCLGVSADISADVIEPDIISSSKWILVEGYLFANSEDGKEAVHAAIQAAKKKNVSVALTLSDAWLVKAYRDDIQQILQSVDLLFSNREELEALTGEEDPVRGIEKVTALVPDVICTSGSEGVYFHALGEKGHVPAFLCNPVDVTGAGDLFAGTVLFGISRELSIIPLLRTACYLCRELILQVGARLESGKTRELFQNTWQKIERGVSLEEGYTPRQ